MTTSRSWPEKPGQLLFFGGFDSGNSLLMVEAMNASVSAFARHPDPSMPWELAMFKLFGLAVLVCLLPFVNPIQAGGSGSGGGGGRVQGELRLEGTITAVNPAAGTVTIRTQAGAAITVTTSAMTKIERNGVQVGLAAFKIGDRGQARYVAGGAAHQVEATGQ
jgi:hypothetical protein